MKAILLSLFLSVFLISCGGSSETFNPDFSPSPGSPSPIVRGAYDLQSSTCRTDGSQLMITQNLNRVFFAGGFDYGQDLVSGFEFSGYIDLENTVHFKIEGETETLDCEATLIEPAFQGTCDLFSGGSCEFIFSRGGADSESSTNENSPDTGDSSVATVYCIHAPGASCEIWNSCYDCGNHRLTQSPSEIEDCVTATFEKKCRGEINNLLNAEDPTRDPYSFVDGCVVDVLKAECDKGGRDFVDICGESDPDSIEGCSVKGLGIDCEDRSIWTCDDSNLLPGDDEREPPDDSGVIVIGTTN